MEKEQKHRNVYLDHAATTPVAPEVVEAMRPYFDDIFGNPSALHKEGRRAKSALQDARKRVADILHAKAEEILFTGSGTESDAMALFGVIRRTKGHCIVGSTEHHAVIHNAEALKREGYAVDICPVHQDGRINIEALEKLIRPETALVSIMYANNEIGTIAPMQEVTRVIRQERDRRKAQGDTKPIYFHTDACQAASYLALDVQALRVDLLTLNGSKIYGPKGVGVLFIRKGVSIEPLWRGGGQEHKLRSGTENVAGIVGLACALELVQKRRMEESARLTALRDALIAGIMERIPKVVLNGHPTERIPNNVNVSILDIEGEALLLYLDHHGIAASTGSACDSITLDPSHVILALGRPYEFAHASMRFTLGHKTTADDIAYVLDVLPNTVTILRKISPVNVDMNATTLSTASAFAGEGLPHWERKRGTKLTPRSLTELPASSYQLSVDEKVKRSKLRIKN